MTARDESMKNARKAMMTVLLEGGCSEADASEIADLAVKAAEEADDAINRVTRSASSARIEYQSLLYAWLIVRRNADAKLAAAEQMSKMLGLTQ